VDVLLVRAGALGDILLLRRAVAALRAEGHRVRLLAPAAPGAALVGPGPAEVDDLLPWDAPEMAALLAGEPARGPFVEALGSADAVIAWTRSADLARALAPVARRLLVHDPAPPPGGPHASVWLARALEPLGLRAPPDPPPLSFTLAESEEAQRRLAPLPPGFLAIHPGSGSPSKNWRLDRYWDLASRWRGTAAEPPGQGPPSPFLLSVGPAELERGLAQTAPPTAVVARAWPLRVLGAALGRADLYVGNDSGASHLAAAAGAPTLALFGPTDPALWSPVGLRVRCLRAADLDALRTDDVLRAAEALRLTSAASGRRSG
jgi:ADP-heptose:LPS heptosyltransferase